MKYPNKLLKRLAAVGLFILVVLFQSCDDFLEEKSDKKLMLPDKLEHLQALLDNSSYPNVGYCVAGEASSDDYYLTDTDFDALREDFRNQYIWNRDHVFIDQASASNSWSSTYQGVYVCTTILDALTKIERTSVNGAEWNSIRGQALAIRAYRYLNAVLIWSVAYNPQTASQMPGLPLRLSPDFNEPSVRASVHETYSQIVNDAKESIPLLPVVNINAYRASKPFAYAMLARTYMAMGDYVQAGLYADSCLQIKNDLMDFSLMNQAAAYPFQILNDETIFLGIYANDAITNNSRAKIKEELYESYDAGDLRKTLFYAANADGTYRFKGSYLGAATLFGGVSVNEIFLIRAECLAREGNTEAAMLYLNTLLEKRWEKDTFSPLVAGSPEAALTIILEERRKELVMTGLRWMDLKRLNREGANITLRRTVKGVEYMLPPNDLRYALALPEDVIALSGMAQNPR